MAISSFVTAKLTKGTILTREMMNQLRFHISVHEKRKATCYKVWLAETLL